MFHFRRKIVRFFLILLFLFSFTNVITICSSEEKINITVSPSELKYVAAVGQIINTSYGILISNYESTTSVIIKLTYVEQGGPFLNVTFSENLFVLKRAVDQINQFQKTVYFTIEVLEGAEGVINGSIVVEATPANQENVDNVMDKEEISVNVEVSEGINLRIKVVDVAGEPISNVTASLTYVTEKGYHIPVYEGKVNDDGILERTLAIGNYTLGLRYKGNNIENSPSWIELTEDTELPVTAYLLTMTPPGVKGIFQWGIGTIVTIGAYDVINVSFHIRNYYNTSKNVTIKAWILDSQSKILSESRINVTIPYNITALNRIKHSITLHPPPEGWAEGRYALNVKIYDEQVLYREKSSTITIIRTVLPFWKQWWFWTIMIVGASMLTGIVFLLKKRKF